MKRLSSLLLWPAAVLPSLLRTAVGVALAPAGGPDTPIHVSERYYTDAEGTELEGFISLPSDHRHEGHDHARDHADTEPVPAVIILHDASGPDDYERQRATILGGDHGYVGFAADIYGYETVFGPEEQGYMRSGRFTRNATLFGMRIQAAVDYVQSLEEVDESRVAIIGYCMGPWESTPRCWTGPDRRSKSPSHRCS